MFGCLKYPSSLGEGSTFFPRRSLAFGSFGVPVPIQNVRRGSDVRIEGRKVAGGTERAYARLRAFTGHVLRTVGIDVHQRGIVDFGCWQR
jgi:hypothetical protein